MLKERWIVPNNWLWVNANDIADIISGGTPKTSNSENFADTGVPWLTPADLSDNQSTYVERGRRDISEQGLKTSSAKLLPKGSVLFTSRAPIGYCVIAANEISTNQGFKNLVLYSDISPEFIRFYLLFSKAYAESLASGSTFKELSGTRFAKIRIPLPPSNEQKRIVGAIEEMGERRDRAKQELEAIRPLLKQFRQSVLAAAFRGDLTADWREQNPDVEPAEVLLEKDYKNLPKTWRWVLVGDVVESLKYGTSKKCNYETEGVPVLRIPNVVDGVIDNSDLKFANLPEKDFEKVKLKAGDILLIRSNGSVSLVGKTAIVTEAEEEYSYAGYLIRIRPNQLVNSQYLNSCLSSFSLRKQIELTARSTSGVNNINSQEVKDLKISLPPLEEQKEIVKRIESLFKLIDNIEQQIEQAETDLETLNQSILAKAFRGELVPQDPNDEPASVLLERIKAEKEASTTKKHKKTKQLEIPGIESK